MSHASLKKRREVGNSKSQIIEFTIAFNRYKNKIFNYVLKMINDRKLPTFAMCDQSIPKAAEFLAHFGFYPVEKNIWRKA